MLTEFRAINSENQKGSEINLLLELEEGKDTTTTTTPTNSDNTRFERLKKLLQKLISELSKVLQNNQNDVDQLKKSCSAKDTFLINSVNSLQEQFNANKLIISQRTEELSTLAEKKDQVSVNISELETAANQLQSSANDRLQISLTLIKTQQYAQLILTEMQKIIQNFKNSFSNIAIPQ